LISASETESIMECERSVVFDQAENPVFRPPPKRK
jgi:hypothetical protein